MVQVANKSGSSCWTCWPNLGSLEYNNTTSSIAFLLLYFNADTLITRLYMHFWPRATSVSNGTFPGKSWKKGFLSPGKSWNFVFTSPGNSWKKAFECLYEPCFCRQHCDPYLSTLEAFAETCYTKPQLYFTLLDYRRNLCCW